MGGRSKEMGKPVSILTPEELQREKLRCEEFLRTVSHGPANKGIKKRLLEINKRYQKENDVLA